MRSRTELRKIIEASNMVLSVCDGAFARDEEGYDILDAGHFRSFLRYPDIFGVESITPEEVEWMRRKILRYKKQLQEMGLDASILDKPVHPVAFFAHAQDWEGRRLRVSPHSLAKFDKMLVEQLKEVEKRGGWVRIKVGYYRDRPLKQLWIRFNDPDENGKTRKWWESKGSGEGIYEDKERLCPRCFLPMPDDDVLCARSHDGKTVICSTCGQIESFERLNPASAEGLRIAQRRAQAALYGVDEHGNPKLPKAGT